MVSRRRVEKTLGFLREIKPIAVRLIAIKRGPSRIRTGDSGFAIPIRFSLTHSPVIPYVIPVFLFTPSLLRALHPTKLIVPNTFFIHNYNPFSRLFYH